MRFTCSLFFFFSFSFLIAQFSKGQKAPNIHTVTTTIEDFDLYQVSAQQPVLLIFYRGYHCTPCNKFLKSLAALEPLLKQKNVLTVFVSPDNPVNLEKTQQKFLNAYPSYLFLHDFDCKIMQDYGVAIKIAPSKESFYKISGFANHKEHFIIPMNSILLINREQTIVYAFHSKSPKKRPSLKTLSDEISKI